MASKCHSEYRAARWDQTPVSTVKFDDATPIGKVEYAFVILGHRKGEVIKAFIFGSVMR